MQRGQKSKRMGRSALLAIRRHNVDLMPPLGLKRLRQRQDPIGIYPIVVG